MKTRHLRMVSTSWKFILLTLFLFQRITPIMPTSVKVASTNCDFPSRQLNALYDLYNATQGNDWRWPSDVSGIPWDFQAADPNPCNNNWQGITCNTLQSGVDCVVTNLNLTKYALKGHLPLSLGDLTNLTTLDLSQNILFGRIPSTLNKAQNLSTLLLVNCGLNGSLPASLGELVNLEDFRVKGNLLTGPVPQTYYTNLPRLRHFNISSNNITGSISPLISNWTQLEVFDIRLNYFNNTIPESITELKFLQQLQIADNHIRGHIPVTLNKLNTLVGLDLSNNSFVGSLALSLNGMTQLQYYSVSRNYLTGTIPDDMFQPVRNNLEVLIFLDNLFHGTIPSSLYDCEKLWYVDLSANFFNGSLSRNVGNMTQLEQLYLSKNALKGSIPHELGEVTSLQIFEVYGNFFTGLLPETMGNLTALTTLDIGVNRLRGSFPTSLCSLHNLQELAMNGNSFDGSLPTCIGNMTAMHVLYMQNNDFTGSLPDMFAALKDLYILYLYDNYLHATIPTSLGEMSQCVQIDLHHNMFTGSLPSSLSNLQHLTILYVNQNFLNGTIPATFGSISHLNELFLYQNEITGSIPASMGEYRFLYAFFAQNNYLSDRIPGSLFHRNNTLSALYLFNNFFTGPLPSSLPQSHVLEFLNVSNNSLSGGFPSNAEDLRYLVSLDLSSNHFEGNLDNIFTKLRRLQVFFVENNHFSGDVNNLFGDGHTLLLRNVDISGNQFSGSLPSNFFNASRFLLSYAAVKNCITGSIPESICSLGALNSLALDGLYTSNACRKTFFPFVQTYALRHSLEGSIPSCLFAMDTLNTLHFSGNGITGSISAELALGEELNDLSLSHNNLKGKIPRAIQEHHWMHLDLSFNKIAGDISNSYFATYSPNSSFSLYLQVNRLSGDIPSQLLDLGNINILQGNMFSCADSLPEHDPNAHSFQCGSNSINTALYMWVGGIFMLVTLVVLLILFIRSSLFALVHNRYRHFQRYWAVFHTPAQPALEIVEEESPVAANGDDVDVDVDVDEDVVVNEEDSTGQDAKERREEKRSTVDIRESFQSLSRSFSVFQGLHRHITMTIKDLPSSMQIHESAKEGKPSFVARESTIGGQTVTEEGGITDTADKESQHDIATPSIYRFGTLMVQLRGFVYYVTLFALLILMPINVIFSYTYFTFQYSYAWKLGYCYLSGVVPAVVVAFLLISFFVYLYRKLNDWRHLSQLIEERDRHTSKKTKTTLDFKGDMIAKMASKQRRVVAVRRFYALAVLIFFFNCVVVMSVNIGYIYATVNRLDQTTLTILAMLVSCFKIAWGSIVLVSVFAKAMLAPYLSEPALLKKFTSWTLSFLVALSLFNNVIAPCIAAAFVSPNCFYYVIESPPPVTVSYEFLQCNSFHSSIGSNQCTDFRYNTHTTSYSPPFFYSFQCSSALINSYADVFIYRYFFTAIVLHFLIYLTKRAQYFTFKRSTSNPIYQTLFKLVSRVLPVLLRPVSQLSTAQSSTLSETSAAVNPLQSSDDVSASSISNSVQSVEDPRLAMYKEVILVDAMLANPTLQQALFDRNRFLVSIITDIAVLITFGIIFPPIALFACINILMSTYYMQLNIGRFVAIAKSTAQSFLLPLVSYLDSQCDGMSHLFIVSIPTLSFLATSFWSFAVFDTLGDDVGLIGAVPVLVVMALLPLLVYGAHRTWEYIQEKLGLYLHRSSEEGTADQSVSVRFRASGFSDFRSSQAQSSFRSSIVALSWHSGSSSRKLRSRRSAPSTQPSESSREDENTL